MKTIRDLEVQCVNYNLTEYLKQCTNEELKYFLGYILCDDIVGIRINIYDALLTEISYRINDGLISKEDNVCKFVKK